MYKYRNSHLYHQNVFIFTIFMHLFIYSYFYLFIYLFPICQFLVLHRVQAYVSNINLYFQAQNHKLFFCHHCPVHASPYPKSIQNIAF